MTLKTTTTPLDRLDRDEWRNTIAFWLGVSYSSLSTDAQTELNRIVNEAHEYVSQRAIHEPWGQRETTKTLTAGTDTTYGMPADFRVHIDVIEEEATGEKHLTAVSDKREFFRGHNGTDTHDWATRTKAVWFFDGMDSSEPPVQQWRRIGVDRSGATARILYVPYFPLVAATGSQDAYPDLPPSVVAAVREMCRYKWALATKDYAVAQFHKAALEDEISSIQISETDSTEAPIRQGFDDAFLRQLG